MPNAARQLRQQRHSKHIHLSTVLKLLDFKDAPMNACTASVTRKARVWQLRVMAKAGESQAVTSVGHMLISLIL